MADSKPARKVSGQKPTREQLEAAQMILAAAKDPQKKVKSSMASFVQYAKANNDELALSSRGEDRRRYMLTYMAMQQEKKETTSRALTFIGCG